MAVACVNDTWFPYSNAIGRLIEQDPDLILFAGDQIYESNAGCGLVEAHTTDEVASGDGKLPCQVVKIRADVS